LLDNQVERSLMRLIKVLGYADEDWGRQQLLKPLGEVSQGTIHQGVRPAVDRRGIAIGIYLDIHYSSGADGLFHVLVEVVPSCLNIDGQ
jgi:hypothetical protein